MFTRPLRTVLAEAEDWRRQVLADGIAQPGGPFAPKRSKPTRRAGKWSRPRALWTPEQRDAEKKSAAHAAQVATVRSVRQAARLSDSRSSAARAGKFIKEAQRYHSSLQLPAMASNASPFVATRHAPEGEGGSTSPAYRGGFFRRGLAASSAAVKNFVLRQARGPTKACNEYARKLVEKQGFAYVPNARCGDSCPCSHAD